MNASDVKSRLRETRIGRLCMAGADGRPYAIPLPFCWHEGALYLRLPGAGRKGDILAENPQVCFEIDWHTDSLDDYGSVIVEGRMEMVEDVSEKLRVRAVNDAKYERLRGGYRPGHGRSTPIEKLSMRKIVVEKISGRQKFAPENVERERPVNGEALVAAAGGGCALCNFTA